MLRSMLENPEYATEMKRLADEAYAESDKGKTDAILRRQHLTITQNELAEDVTLVCVEMIDEYLKGEQTKDAWHKLAVNFPCDDTFVFFTGKDVHADFPDDTCVLDVVEPASNRIFIFGKLAD